jgi:hypothetical protein
MKTRGKHLLYTLLLSALTLFIAADKVHFRVVDSFLTPKEWIPSVISDQQYGPLFHVGIWSDPLTVPSFKEVNGKGIFHFPRLETWNRQGFEYFVKNQRGAYQYGIEKFEDANYLTFNVVNRSNEAVKIKFRVMDDVTYTFSNQNGTTYEEALCEFVTNPGTLTIQPNKPSVRIRIKLVHPDLKDSNRSDIQFKPWFRFFAFEVQRIKHSDSKHPAIDCTLEIDHLQVKDDMGKSKD